MTMILEGKARLRRIAEIIEDVDNRCMAVDGPVTPTNEEITLKEIQEIYLLASKATSFRFVKDGVKFKAPPRRENRR